MANQKNLGDLCFDLQLGPAGQVPSGGCPDKAAAHRGRVNKHCHKLGVRSEPFPSAAHVPDLFFSHRDPTICLYA